MLSTFLLRAPWLAFSVLIALILAAPFAGVWFAAHRRVTAVLLGAATLGTAILTLYPAGASYGRIACNVGLPYLAPTAVESTANILLFVPIAFLGAVLWKRPILAIVGASVLSALIELIQAVVLVIGRACDTSDWITNTIGALIGGALAAGALIWRRRRLAQVD